MAAGDSFTARVRVRNTGPRAGTDLVQLYARDVQASITRPVAQLLAYQRVTLQPGEEALVTFQVPTTRLAFTDRAYRRIVEPGEVELWVGPSCAEKEATGRITVLGPVHEVALSDPRVATGDVQVLRTDDELSESVARRS